MRVRGSILTVSSTRDSVQRSIPAVRASGCCLSAASVGDGIFIAA